MSEYDPTGLMSSECCPARHPVTGNGCTMAPEHEGLHLAMGTQRVQMFGESATCSEAPR